MTAMNNYLFRAAGGVGGTVSFHFKWLIASTVYLVVTLQTTIGGQFTITSPESLAQSLLRGSVAERNQAAKALALMMPTWTATASMRLVPCTEFTAVRTSAASLRLGNPGQVILEVTADPCDLEYLVLLERQKPSSWRHLGTIPLSIHYGHTPEVTLQELIKPKEQEIVVRHLLTDWGTGFWQEDMVVLKLIGARLMPIFDEVETLRFEVPVNGNVGIANTEQEENSEFVIVDAKAGAPSPKQITQRQIIRDHGTQIVRGFVFYWSPELHKYRKFAVSSDSKRLWPRRPAGEKGGDRREHHGPEASGYFFRVESDSRAR